jgi:hypothetical protein
LLVLPILCLQTSESAGQEFKSLAVRENTSHSLNLGVEGWDSGVVCRFVWISGPITGSLLGRENLDSPLLQESKESALTGGTVPNQSKPMTNQTADKDADKSENRVCEWATHIIWLVVCGWLGIWLGYYKTLLPPASRDENNHL